MINRIVKFFIVAGLAVSSLFFATVGRAQTHAHNNAASRCERLANEDFSGIPGAATELSTVVPNRDSITIAKTASADGFELPAFYMHQIGQVEPFCTVSGYVVPDVGFVIVLPQSGWNGKLLHLGCGGWCGTTSGYEILCALHPHYACMGTDMGHRGTGGLWNRANLQGQIDFSYRATHVATLAGKAIVERYYATKPLRTYFFGCSTGGYQGMVEAQRFPWDFDGIIAGAPDMDEADLALRALWVSRSFFGHGSTPILNQDDLKVLHKAALAACDLDDGVKDGIISAPTSCDFDPIAVRCGVSSISGCLTDSKIAVAREIYGPPHTSTGFILSSSGVLPGSELNWTTSFSKTWGDDYLHSLGISGDDGQPLTRRNFDFDKDYQKLGIGSTYEDTDPDLRRFKAAGGKLIIYQGGNDTDEIPGAVIDYYRTVQQTMGGREKTQEFARLFIVPAMNHCTGGEGPFAIDFLSALENWVEYDRVPEALIGAHVLNVKWPDGLLLRYPLNRATAVSFSRPVYAYPRHARYAGSGDSSKAKSFYPAEDAERMPN